MSSRYSDYYNESKSEKCRVCSDFKQWTKQQIPENQKNTENIKSVEQKGCPLDREELGKNTWSFLHTMAAYFPEHPSVNQQSDMKHFIGLFSKFYPCKECADDMKEDISKDPPIVNSRYEFSQWLCHYHNKVNQKLGKPLFDCSRIDERWQHGWKDGSCD